MTDKIMWLTPIFLGLATVGCIWQGWTVTAAIAGVCTGFVLGIEYMKSLQRNRGR